MCLEIKISYSLYKKYNDLLQMKEKQRINLCKKRGKLILKDCGNEKEDLLLKNDLYVICEKITYKSGEIEILRKFLNEIIAENKEGRGTV
jgi:hypothetical protein